MIATPVQHILNVNASTLDASDVIHVTYTVPSASIASKARSYYHVQMFNITPSDVRHLRETIGNTSITVGRNDLRKAYLRKVKQLSISNKCEGIWTRLNDLHHDDKKHNVIIVAPSTEVGEAIVTAINQIMFGSVRYKDGSINHYVYGHMIAASSYIPQMRWINANPTYTWKQHFKIALHKLCKR